MDEVKLLPLHIVFDGPPGPEAGRFVECERPDGSSLKAGEWHERDDGYWELRVPARVEATHPTLVTDELVELREASAFLCQRMREFGGSDLGRLTGAVEQVERIIAAMPTIPSQSLDASETQEQWLAHISAEQNRLRLLWLANAVLACDYGDNDTGGQIGWGVRADVRSGAPLMFGPSINAAIDNAIATGTAETPTPSPAIDQDGGEA